LKLKEDEFEFEDQNEAEPEIKKVLTMLNISNDNSFTEEQPQIGRSNTSYIKKTNIS